MYVAPGVKSRKLSGRPSRTEFAANLCRAVASFPSLPEMGILTRTFQNHMKDTT